MKNILIVLIMVMVTGCNYLEDYSQDLVLASSVSDFDEVLLGDVYIPSKTEVKDLAWGDVGWWLHIMDDDVNGVVAREAENREWNYAMTSSYFGYTAWQMEVGRNYDGDNLAADNALWDDFYKRINICNIILDEIEDIDPKTEEERLAGLRVRGETHFLRAQFYFVLVNVYANAYNPENAKTTLGIPLKLTSYVEHDKDKDTQFERASVAKVYEQIVKDLNLSIDYLTKSPQTHSFYRASKEAAMLLLSRVYLYMQEWENAKVIAGELLKLKSTLKSYAALGNEDEVISKTNPEVLFSQGSLNLQQAFTGEGGDFCISKDLYELYADDDYRKMAFFGRSTNSDSIALGLKYKKGLHQSYVSDLYLLRTSEAYLNMAEACAMLDQNKEASDWLNRFRRNRIEGWQDVVYDQTAVIDEVRNERRKELCLEGHRWFDLRRYAVCKKAPFNKEIMRIFPLYNYNNQLEFISARVYCLEKNDPAYTLSIPKSVLEFDTGMPDNTRPIRKSVRTITFDFN